MASLPRRAGRVFEVSALACLFIVILPSILAAAFGVSPAQALGLVGSTFVLECFAIPLGIGLSLPAVYVFPTVVSAGIGIFILTLGTFQILGSQSRRLVDFLLKWRGRVSPVQKYGIYGLIPGAVLLGLYGCAATAWALGWGLRQSTLLTTLGFVLVSTVFLLSSIGIFRIILPG